MNSKKIIENQEVTEVNLTDYLYVILKWRKVIFYFVGISFVISFLIMFFIVPRWYKSTAVVIPPKQKAQFSASSLLKNVIPFSGFGLSKGVDDLNNYMAILESRSCLEEIINRFNLIKRYDVENMDDCIKEIKKNIEIELASEDVVLEITVYDTDKKVAAEMANAFVEVLNRINLSMASQEAKSNRQFIEKRYNQNREDLKVAEENLRNFQQKFGVLSLPDQVKAAVQAAAQIKSQILLREVEYGVLHNSVSENDPQLREKKNEIDQLNDKFRELQVGKGNEKGAEIFSPFDKTPELGLQFARYFREVEIQEKMLEVLMPLLEQAKIEEYRDTPSLLVLDVAVPGDKQAKPRRIVWVIIITMSSVFLSIFLIFAFDSYQRIRRDIQQGSDEKLKFIQSQMTWKLFFHLNPQNKITK